MRAKLSFTRPMCITVYMCVCVCACARARAPVYVGIYECTYVYVVDITIILNILQRRQR